LHVQRIGVSSLQSSPLQCQRQRNVNGIVFYPAQGDHMVFVDLVQCVCTGHSSIFTCVTAEHDVQLGCAIKLCAIKLCV